MKIFFRLFILFIFLSSFGGTLHAQNYKWVTGGGSTDLISPSGGTFNEAISYMCTDANGNLYFTSSVGNNDITVDSFYRASSRNASLIGTNVFLGSYDCNKHLRWGKLLEAQFITNSFGLVYQNGSIYCAGELYGANKYVGLDTLITSKNLNAFLARFDTSGKLKWIRFAGADASITRSESGGKGALAIDGQGYIHYYSLFGTGVQITPTITSRYGTYDLKYDSTGNLISAIRLPIDSAWDVQSIAINRKSGSAYAVVNYPWGGGVQYYLAGFDTSGHQLWSDTCCSLCYVYSVNYDNAGSIYCTEGGDIFKNDTITNGAISSILRLDTLGNIKKVYPFYGTGSGTNLLYLTLLPRNQIAVVGTIQGEVKYGNDSIICLPGGMHPLITIIDSSGKLIKLDQLHSSGFYDWGTAIGSDIKGNVFIGGQIESDITVAGMTYNSVGGNTDFFVAKYGYNCNCTLSTEPTPNFSYIGSGTVDFTYTGSVTPDSVRWDFGDGTNSKTLNPTHNFHDTGEHHVCLTVFACDSGTYCSYIQTTTGVPTITWMENVTVYPNPAKDRFFIEGAENGTRFELINIVGQHLLSGLITDNKQSINVSNLIPGMYIIQLINANGKTGSTRIVKQ